MADESKRYVTQDQLVGGGSYDIYTAVTIGIDYGYYYISANTVMDKFNYFSIDGYYSYPLTLYLTLPPVNDNKAHSLYVQIRFNATGSGASNFSCYVDGNGKPVAYMVTADIGNFYNREVRTLVFVFNGTFWAIGSLHSTSYS